MIPGWNPTGRPLLAVWKSALNRERELAGEGTLQSFASGHLWFGIHRHEGGLIMREWAPNASAIFLMGDFNNWQVREDFRFKSAGTWKLGDHPGEGNHRPWGSVQTTGPMGRRRGGKDSCLVHPGGTGSREQSF